LPWHGEEAARLKPQNQAKKAHGPGSNIDALLPNSPNKEDQHEHFKNIPANFSGFGGNNSIFSRS
jgi:hypothetical protein